MRRIAHYMVFPLFILLFHLINETEASGGIPGVQLIMPPSITALSGDLHLQIVSSSFPPLAVQLSRLEGNAAQPLTTFPVFPEASALKRNTTIVKMKCGYFSRGGQYYIQVKKQPMGTNTTIDSTESNTITRSLDVRWPMPQLTVTPEHVQTYPESPVSAVLSFPEVVCAPLADSPASAIPEFWLELRYCGHSLLTCDSDASDQGGNKTTVQVLYSQQVRGFPGHRGQRVYTLRCELFGLAGHYALLLRPTNPTPTLPNTVAYIKADWSEQFVFNVHARSIMPCDVHSGGITVLFQYPSCILGTGDRVRLFARLRANVASLAPPTTLEYVAEQRVTRGQHSLHFNCDLFTERYVEYCFVYVSQAITGAVADVRIDCVPTLPVTEQDSGGWGNWSEWTPCSSTCIGGIRSRYRFCDSPPPRYGAKFCEGQAVETEKCGLSLGSWECFYGSGVSGNDVVAEIPEVQAEVGPYCRCGCVVHLGQAKPRRLLATSSQSCPGRTFWLIQADENCIVQFKVEQFYLPCGNQWLKVRDGSSLSSNLLADLTGEPDTTPALVNSTGSSLLLEFYSDDFIVGGQLCSGGFLAHAIQLRHSRENITEIPAAQSIAVLPASVLKLTAVHIATIFFLSGLIIATTLLGAQYLFRYRKYHVAQAEDLDSLADPAASNNSFALATRASSNATLLSEVISLTRLRPLQQMKTSKNKHVRLRESMDCDRDRDEEHEVTLAKEEDSLSGSTATLTAQNETSSTSALQNSGRDQLTPTYSLPSTPQLADRRVIRRSSTINSGEKDKSNEKDEQEGRITPREIFRRLSNVSNGTLTNVSEMCSKSDPGCYSSAASMVSTATIRSVNAKAAKDKRNREKVLAGPAGSEFSIVGPDVDLEMDYYDYNVVNAGAAPGSYLGMDPAFLVWIPPIDESGEILPMDGHPECHEMGDIRPRVYVDPGSNKESPEEEMLLPKPRTRSISEGTPRSSPIMRKNKKVHPLVLRPNEGRIDNRYLRETEPFLNKTTTIQLHEFSSNKPRISPKLSRKDMEKETMVEKSPSVDSTFFDELKFADDEDDVSEEEDLRGTQCNIERISYQDSNIISSS